MSRRHTLVFLLFAWTLVLAAPKLAYCKFQGLSILQGYTTDSEAQFSILHPKSVKPLIFIRGFESAKTFKPKPVDITRVEMPHSTWATSRAQVFQLAPGRDYILEVWTQDKFRKLDTRKFRTLDLRKSRVDVVVASCMDLDPKYNQQRMWSDAQKLKPDLIFLLGDTVYAHRGTTMIKPISSEHIWDAYVEARLTIELYRADRLVPTLATWDDGDFGSQDGDQTFPYKTAALSIFEAFFPQMPDKKHLVAGPGVARFFRGFGINFFFMDNRSFRSPERTQTHWGTEQENWLMTNLQKHPGPSFIIQGDQFFGGYHKFESYERQHPHSFKAVTADLKKIKGPVMFLSGDRHLTELIGLKGKEWPYKTFEFTSSGIHAKTYPGSFKEFPNRRQIAGRDGIQNYGFLKLANLKKGLAVSVTAYGPKQKRLFQRQFTVKGR